MLHVVRVVAAAATALCLAGCAAPPVSGTAVAVADQRAPPVVKLDLPFDQAVAQATDGLVAQAEALPAFANRATRRGVVIDPMLDAGTGQQTAATQRLQRQVAARFAQRLPAAELLPLTAASLPRAHYLLTGTLTRALADQRRGSLLVNLALTQVESGRVVAQAWALTRDTGLDDTPLPFYADSPVLMKDRLVEGYVSTSATGAGKRADAAYLERIALAPALAEAAELYNARRYAEALATYQAARNAPGGAQLRVLSGLYLTQLRLGRPAEAEQAFGELVANGIANRSLGVKFLFRPGSTLFPTDPAPRAAYPMWLRQIAREAVLTGACMTIVGHTSRSGSAAANEALSLQRASFIRQRLAAEPGAGLLLARTTAQGLGSRENIVGSGTDDALDALDRRVELRIVPCTG